MTALRHLRRPQAQLEEGNWVILCDCGWKGCVPCQRGAHVKTGAEVEEELEAAFKAHLPEAEQVSYILVDQRQVEMLDESTGRLVMVPVGNFLMPIAQRCTLLKHRQRDGVRYASYLVPETGESGELPVGEVRTADSRVFKLDS